MSKHDPKYSRHCRSFNPANDFDALLLFSVAEHFAEKQVPFYSEKKDNGQVLILSDLRDEEELETAICKALWELGHDGDLESRVNEELNKFHYDDCGEELVTIPKSDAAFFGLARESSLAAVKNSL